MSTNLFTAHLATRRWRRLLYVSIVITMLAYSGLALSCSSSEYYSNPDRRCRPCNSACGSCYGDRDNNCHSCKTPRCYYYGNSSCVDKCPPHFWKDSSDTYGWVCRKCDSSCNECTGSSPFKCTSCLKPKYFYSGNNSCVDTCPPGTWADSSDDNNRVCRSCDPSCKTCNGAGPNYCTSCRSDFYFVSSTKSCVVTCPAGTYCNSDNRTCDACHPSCATCSGASETSCLTCANGKYFLNSSGTCGVCPAGYYGDNTTKCCTACYRGCRSCTGPLLSQCTACQNSAYSPFCSCGRCPDGKWCNIGAGTSGYCHKDCRSCSGPRDSDCGSCASPRLLYQNKCVKDCVPGCYQNDWSKKCEKCDSSCKTCNGASAYNCLTCADSLCLTPSHNCVATCPNGTYASSSSRECLPCHASCRVCNSPSACSSCRSPNFSYDGRCQSFCPSGWDKDDNSRACRKHPRQLLRV